MVEFIVRKYIRGSWGWMNDNVGDGIVHLNTIKIIRVFE